MASNEQDLEPLLNAQQNQLSLVFSDSNTIDAKALAILAANIAILIFIRQVDLDRETWQLFLLYAPFGLSLILDVISIWPRRYLGAVTNIDQSPQYLAMDRQTLLLQLLADTDEAIAQNEKLNKKRLRFCLLSIALTGLGFLLLLLIL